MLQVFFTAIGEYGAYKVNIVTQYLHLGGTTHFSGDLRKEIKRRIAISNQSFNKHRKLIYQNTDLAPVRRIEIFNSLILSRLLFGAEMWFIQDQKTKDYLHSAIMRLYKRLLRCPFGLPRFLMKKFCIETELPAPSHSVATEEIELSQFAYCGGAVSTLGTPQTRQGLDESPA